MVDHLLTRQSAEIQIGLIDVDERTILHPSNGCGDRVDVEEPGKQVARLAEPAVGIIQFTCPAAYKLLQLGSRFPLALFGGFESCNIQKGDYNTFNFLFSRAIRTHAYHVPGSLVSLVSLHFLFYRRQVT